MKGSKDLFDDTTMSFGEHLEVLRVHLWKAIIGLVIGVMAALFCGGTVVSVIRAPIDKALQQFGLTEEATDDVTDFDFWEYVKSQFSADTTPDNAQTAESTDEPPPDKISRRTIEVQVKVSDIADMLHKHDPKSYPAPTVQTDEEPVALRLSAPEFAVFRKTTEDMRKPVALNVQEAFLTYLKVSFVAGLLFASPWVFYQLWLFVAAGLYPHERRYIHVFLPMSVILFVGGALFCFFMVFPFVLKFLLSFNRWLEVEPQIRLSEWISFAITLPLMFGISFQLPLVMLFLERISIFEVADYREKRRFAVLVIATLSMLLTPADPMSMLMMMLPLLCLYELGIQMCRCSMTKSPFEPETAMDDTDEFDVE